MLEKDIYPDYYSYSLWMQNALVLIKLYAVSNQSNQLQETPQSWIGLPCNDFVCGL